MSILDKIFGKRLASGADRRETLSIMTGVPALGLDALSSSAYGPEAALMVLLPLGLLGLDYFFVISLLIVATLIILYLSYQQTTAAYPSGGGAYIVASDNLGKKAGLWAAVALLIDYLLNVAVGISAGVGVVVSVIPMLHPYILELCLFVLAMLAIINLRGTRESGFAFVIPVIIFIICISAAIFMGLFQTWKTHGHPLEVIVQQSLPDQTRDIGIWILLGAFANGLTAMTGVEAVSNAVPLFRKPSVKNAQWTLTIIVGVLALFLVGLGYLCPRYHISAMNEIEPGYKTILSQLISAVFGEGVFYYISIASIFIVLTYSAQTSFVGFPRVCRLLAEDDFLPHFFADKGRRLVYSAGIIILAIFSGLLLIAFKGITFHLIPLFAVGAFTAFLFSQIGMIVHWHRRRTNKLNYIKLFFNGLGAITTAVALMIIITVKFSEGAWVVVILAPILVALCVQIRRHYRRIHREIDHPLKLHTLKLKKPIVLIPIKRLDRVAEKALEMGMLISDDVTAINVSGIKDDDNHPLRQSWKEIVGGPSKEINYKKNSLETNRVIPKLEIIECPYREIYKPILQFVKKIRKTHPNRIIAIIIPVLVEPHWYEYLLHNIYATGLRAFLFLARDQKTIIVDVPWYLREK